MHKMFQLEHNDDMFQLEHSTHLALEFLAETSGLAGTLADSLWLGSLRGI
jgi:hypothetical protein